MSQLSKSYNKVHYEFRPAKQVERRMLIHTFQSLMEIGFPISEYKYTGFGSIYFIDFVMFHRYLGINKFLSVEASVDIARRVKFNRPYGCVKIAICDIADIIPMLSPNMKHILWLDFDYLLTEELLDSVNMAAAQLSAGSVLIVTVDVEPPGKPEDGLGKWNPRQWRKHFLKEGRAYLWSHSLVSEFSRDHLPNANARFIESAINKGIMGRSGISFFPLFAFIYSDGHRMLSLGGMVGTKDEQKKLASLNRKELFFLKSTLTKDPYKIVVPKVTRKERLYLDRMMPCRKNWSPKDFEFESDKLSAYRKIYKYYPAYTEMFL